MFFMSEDFICSHKPSFANIYIYKIIIIAIIVDTVLHIHESVDDLEESYSIRAIEWLEGESFICQQTEIINISIIIIIAKSHMCGCLELCSSLVMFFF